MDSGSIAAGTPVLVTGATGFTGAVVARRLAEQGCRVRAIARESSDLSLLEDLDIQWVRGDVFDRAVVEEAARGVEYAFHMAAAYREARVGDAVYQRVHVESTQRLAEALSRQPGFRRLVHVSTVGVHGHIENPPASEESRFNPGDIYQVTKAAAEQWIRAMAKQTGLPLTVIRPAAIYGPGDRRLLKVFKMALWPVFPILGRGRCLYHLIHVEDLAGIIVLAATHPAALNEVFIAGNPEPVTLDGMARTIAVAAGRPGIRVVRIPAWPFFLAGAVCEGVCRPLGIEPPIYRRRVAFFTKDRAFDTRKLRDRLGYQYRYSTEEGLRQTTQWYQDHGWLKGKRTAD